MNSEKKTAKSGNKIQTGFYVQSTPKNIFSRLDNEGQRNSCTLSKNKGRFIENSSVNKTLKSKSKMVSSLSLLTKYDNKHKNLSGKRLVSDFSSKQLISHSFKTGEKKELKYIFNTVKNVKNRNALTIKPKNTASSSHNKSYSNQTVIRNGQKKNFVFNKSSNSDLTKKKKKHDYIKSFNKTSCLQKMMSMGFHSMGQQLNDTLGTMNLEKYNSKASKYNLNQTNLKTSHLQFQKLKVQNKRKLNQIRNNSDSLFKKIKSPHKAKLTLVVNGYEKIVSELYGALARNISLPECDISRIHTSNSHPASETINYAQAHQNSLSKTTPSKLLGDINVFEIRDSEITESDSEHWDSYLDYGQDKQNTKPTMVVRSASQKNMNVKMLNLADLKKGPIKQYHQQFMDQQQFFSDSWKRELGNQKRF